MWTMKIKLSHIIVHRFTTPLSHSFKPSHYSQATQGLLFYIMLQKKKAFKILKIYNIPIIGNNTNMNVIMQYIL
jgi:hypothetical protein